MAAPTVIRWDTPGAPPLLRVASSFISVLDFCLVQRGWSKEMSDTDKAVYRAGSGERKFYRVLNDGSFSYSGTSYQYTMAKISMYDSMTTIDTGVGLTGHAYLSACGATTSTARPWVVIVDETGFFFISFPHLAASSFTLSTAIGIVQYVGETIPALPGNTVRNVLAGGNMSMIPHYGSSIECIGNGDSTFVNRSLDGTRTNIKSRIQKNGGEPAGVVNLPYGNSANAPLSYPYNGELLYAMPLLDDALDYTMGDHIPGLYYPCQKGHTLNSFQDYTADGKTLRAFRTHAVAFDIGTAQAATFPNSNIGACLIDVSAGFRP